MLYTSPKTACTFADLETYSVPTREELRELRKGPENMGARWQPINHHALVTQLHEAIESRGFTVESESFCTSDDGLPGAVKGHDIFGHIQIGGVDIARTDMAPVLGFRSSNLQRFRLVGVTGSRVFICANGMISGEFVFGFKHTTGNVRGMSVGINDGMDAWQDQAQQMNRLVSFMEETPVADKEVDHLLVEAMRRDVFSSSQIKKIDETYRGYLDPEHAHHSAFADRNVWSLYNAVTEVGKGWSTRNIEKGLKRFPRMVADLHGFELSTLEAPRAADGTILN